MAAFLKEIEKFYGTKEKNRQGEDLETFLEHYDPRKYETQAMVAKVPVMNGTTDAVSMMSYGFDPYLSSWSPYHGAIYAVVESVAKIVAAGGDYSKIRFTFQEYFRRMTEDPKRWSQPFAALLGASPYVSNAFNSMVVPSSDRFLSCSSPRMFTVW